MPRDRSGDGRLLRWPAAVLFLSLAYAQGPGGPRFDVASIKPSLSPAERRAQGQPQPRSVTDGARLQMYTSMAALLRRAYKLESYQKLIGPDWMDATWYEVAATLPSGATQDQIPEMLQALLVDRFKLAVRRESKREYHRRLGINARSHPRCPTPLVPLPK